jgi:hypothetical protein
LSSRPTKLLWFEGAAAIRPPGSRTRRTLSRSTRSQAVVDDRLQQVRRQSGHPDRALTSSGRTSNATNVRRASVVAWRQATALPDAYRRKRDLLLGVLRRKGLRSLADRRRVPLIAVP